MTTGAGEVDGGRLVVDVYGDTTGFGRDVQRRLDAETAKVRARIRAELDAKALGTDARKAAAEVGRATTITIRAQVDRAALQKSLDAAVRAVKASVGVKLAVDRAAFQRDIEATLRAVKPTVGVKINVDREAFARNLDSAIRSVAPAVGVKLGVDHAKLHAEIDKAVQASRPPPLDVDVNAASAAAEAQIDLTARDRTSTIEVDADTAKMEAEVAAAKKRAGNPPAYIGIGADPSGLRALGRTFMQIGKLPMLAGGVTVLVSAVGQLAGGLFAMGAAASQAVGTLAILPNLAGVAAQSIGVLMAGFSGIGDAVKALGEAEAQGAADATAAADAREAAADRVKAAREAEADAARNTIETEQAGAEAIADAQERVAEARKAANEAAISGAEAVREAQEAAAETAVESAERVKDAQQAAAQAATSGAQQIRAAEQAVIQARQAGVAAVQSAQSSLENAEYNMARAIENTRAAQVALTQAREDARERMEDLELSMARSALNEEAAILAVQRARERLNDVNSDPMSSDLDRREADLAYRSAVQSLEEVQESNEDLRETKRESDREGVEGSDEVQNAHDRVAEALRSQQQAAENLAAAQKNLAAAQVDAARAVAQAQRGVAQATRDAAAANAEAQEQVRETIRAAAEANADAQENVRDAADSAAEANIDAAERVADAQEALGDTRRDAAQANVDAVRNETQAEENLRDALEDQKDTLAQVSTSAGNLTTAMDNLSPAGQRFAKFIQGTLQPRLRQLRFAIQEALLPPVQRGVEAAMPFLDTLEVGLTETAAVIGRTIERLGEKIGSGPFNERSATIMASNNEALRDFGAAFLAMFDAASRVAVAAGPQLERFSEWIKDSARDLRDLVNINTQPNVSVPVDQQAANRPEPPPTSDLEDFFTRAGDRAAQLGRIFGNVSKALFGIGEAAIPAGDQLLDALENITAEWAEWTNDLDNQAAMREGFEAIVPAVKAMGNLFIELVEVVAAFATSGGTAVKAFADTLTFLFNGLDALLSSPIGPFINTFLTIAGVAGALSLVSGMVLSMAGSFSRLFRILKQSAMFGPIRSALFGLANMMKAVSLAAARQRIAMMLSAGAAKAQAAATWLVTTAQKAWTGAVWLFNAAWAANPIGVVIAAILAIGAGLVLAYRHFEGFRNVVDAVVGAVVSAFQWLWDVLVGHSIIPDLMAALRTLGDVFEWLYNNVVQPVARFIVGAFKLLWNGVKRVFGWIKSGVNALGDVFQWLWKNVVRRYVNFYIGAFKLLWSAVKRIFGWLKDGIHALGDVVEWLWDKAVKPTVNFIKDGFARMWRGIERIFGWFKTGLDKVGDAAKWLWNNAIKPVLGWIKDGFDRWWSGAERIFGWFKTGLGKVGDAFGALKDAAKTALDWIVDTVTGIPDKLGNLAGKFLEAGKDLIGALGDGLMNMGDFVADIGTDLVNWIVGKLNDAIPDKIPIPGAPDLDLPNDPIPTLATGGRAYPDGAVVNIAEGGEPETVLPDRLLAQLVSNVAAAAFRAPSRSYETPGVTGPIFRDREGGGEGDLPEVFGKTERQVEDSLREVGDHLDRFRRRSLTPFAEDMTEQIEGDTGDSIGRFVKDTTRALDRELGPAFQDVYDDHIAPTLKDTRDNVRDTWRERIRPDFNDMEQGIRDTWRDGIKPTLNDFTRHLKRDTAVDVRDGTNTIDGHFTDLKTDVRSTWTEGVRPVLNDFSAHVKRTLPPQIAEGVVNIGAAWGKVEAATKGPIGYVIRTVLNQGLIGAFNKIARFVDADPIDAIAMPKGWATGGYTGPGGKYQPAGIVHRDEFVVRSESRRKIERTHPGFLDALNRHGDAPLKGDSHNPPHAPLLDRMRGGVGYANGGLVTLPNYWVGGGVLPMPSADRGFGEPTHGTNYFDSWYATDMNRGSGTDDLGDRIVAWKAGQVAYVNLDGEDGSYGNETVINHDDGNWTRYAHQMDNVRVTGGQEVARGEHIGSVGHSGTDSPHLHFEIGGGREAVIPGGGTTSAPSLPKWAQNIVDAPNKWARGLLTADELTGGFGRLTQDLLHNLVVPAAEWATDQLGSMAASAAGAFGAGAEGVWKALMSTGYFTKRQAAGVMGNIQTESGGTFDPNIVQGMTYAPTPAGITAGYGLVQWTPGTKLIPYIGEGTVATVANEIDALVAQLQGKGSSPEGAAGTALLGTRTVAAAARSFMLDYERPADQSESAIAPRVSQAQGWYERFAANGVQIPAGMTRIISGGGESVVSREQSAAFVELAKAAAAMRTQRIGPVDPAHPVYAGRPDPMRRVANVRGRADLVGAGAGGGVIFEEGAIQVHNPSPEPASTSINARLRTLAAFGLFDSGGG